MAVDTLSAMGLSAVGGFIMQYISAQQKMIADRFERDKEATAILSANNDAAAKRVPPDVGKGMRRILVLAILFAAVVAPFITPLVGISTWAEVTQIQPASLFGLIPESTRKFFVEIPGYLFTEDTRTALLSIISFYFGASVGKTNGI